MIFFCSQRLRFHCSRVVWDRDEGLSLMSDDQHIFRLRCGLNHPRWPGSQSKSNCTLISAGNVWNTWRSFCLSSSATCRGSKWAVIFFVDQLEEVLMFSLFQLLVELRRTLSFFDHNKTARTIDHPEGQLLVLDNYWLLWLLCKWL